MPKKQPIANGFVLFDVLYEDGTQTSNRRVPAAELGGLDGDLPAKAIVESRTARSARCRAFRAPALSPSPARAKPEGRFPARGGILGGCCPIAPLPRPAVLDSRPDRNSGSQQSAGMSLIGMNPSQK